MRILTGIFAVSLLASCSGTGTVPSVPLEEVNSNSAFEILLNDARTTNSVGTVAFDSRLAVAAQSHADDMVAQGYLSHTGLNGSTPETRATAAGYNWTWIGENIGQGQQTQASIMSSWMNSTTGHRENNLNPNFDDFGLGVAGNGNERRWVLMLGAE